MTKPYLIISTCKETGKEEALPMRFGTPSEARTAARMLEMMDLDHDFCTQDVSRLDSLNPGSYRVSHEAFVPPSMRPDYMKITRSFSLG